MTSLAHLSQSVIRCRKCSRLVRWREQVSKSPPQRYQGENYWAKPLPGFGDPQARVLIVGLAPAAHGGNRTGRMFTGDRSGHWRLAAHQKSGALMPKPRPLFGHGKSIVLPNRVTLICSYHPSQQNTFTGKLTQPMFQAVFRKVTEVLSSES